MTENFPDELYQMQSKHAKGTKRRANITLEVEGEKRFKTYFNVREYANSKKKTIYFSYSNDILNQLKTFVIKNFYTKRQSPKLLLLNF